MAMHERLPTVLVDKIRTGKNDSSIALRGQSGCHLLAMVDSHLLCVCPGAFGLWHACIRPLPDFALTTPYTQTALCFQA